MAERRSSRGDRAILARGGGLRQARGDLRPWQPGRGFWMWLRPACRCLLARGSDEAPAAYETSPSGELHCCAVGLRRQLVVTGARAWGVLGPGISPCWTACSQRLHAPPAAISPHRR